MKQTTKSERRIAKRALLQMKRIHPMKALPGIAAVVREYLRESASDHDPIPYTHWMYFPDEQSARDCAAAMPEFRTRLDPPSEDSEEWLLRAEAETTNLRQRDREVTSIAMRHGGRYDGGETTIGPDGFEPDPYLA